MHKTLNTRTVTVAIAGLLLLCLTGCQINETSRSGGSASEEPQVEGFILSGSAASQVRIEVFSDFECPGCRKFFVDTLKPVIRDYKDKVSVVYYEFPLNAHPQARPAARYVTAAAKLGPQKAALVFEAIFNDQAQWAADGRLEDSVEKALSREDFMKIRKILQDAGLFAEIEETIEKERMLGVRKGVNSTPTMFISHGGREQKVDGPTIPTYQVLKQFLDPIVK